MTSHTIDTAHSDDDIDARIRNISDRILDGVEETLDDLAQPHQLHAAIERVVLAQCAAMVCRHARCRRAQRCRRTPCAAPAA